jgi:hypothetical protein
MQFKRTIVVLALVALLLNAAATAFAGFTLGDSPAWSGTGAANASDTAKATTEGLHPGNSASDTAVGAAGVKPNSNRQSP